MRMNFITLSFFLFIIFNMNAIAQLEIKLETDKTEYKREDSSLAEYKIKNISSDVVIFLNKIYIATDNHCFGVYRYNDYVQLNSADNHNLNDFITLHPDHEISITKSLDISWLCRSAPPQGDWNVELFCTLIVNDTDNYYIINDSENQKRKINMFEAWVGSVVSNEVNIIIKRTD